MYVSNKHLPCFYIHVRFYFRTFACLNLIDEAKGPLLLSSLDYYGEFMLGWGYNFRRSILGTAELSVWKDYLGKIAAKPSSSMIKAFFSLPFTQAMIVKTSNDQFF